jgi:hypothetical protein
MSDLERTISMFRQQQPQVPQIPQFPAVSQAPATQGLDFQKILAVMSAQKQMPPAPIVPQVPPSQPAMAPNLAAIISQFANQNQQAGSSQPSGQHYEDPERKRMRETDGSEESGDDRFGYAKRSKFGAPNKKHVSILPRPDCKHIADSVIAKGWISPLPILARRKVSQGRQLHLPP